MPRIAMVFGTRPETTKMAPVVHAVRSDVDLEGVVIVSGQHRQQLDSALHDLDLHADYDLHLMKEDQPLADLVAQVIAGTSVLLREVKPDLVLVHGDTGTTAGAAQAAFYENMRLGHIEAGLRSGSIREPFPEEGNRRLADTVSDMLFAPTEWAASNLYKEGFDVSKIVVTGNTAIDTLRLYVDKARSTPIEGVTLNPSLRLITVTAHRRESFGEAFRNLCAGLRRIVDDHADVEIVYPVHLNPNVRRPVNEMLGNHSRIHLIEPLSYLQFVHLMALSDFLITDSGGLQEEAPFLKKPVLIMRDRTERPEVLEAGTGLLVGTKTERIAAEADRLLRDRVHYEAMANAPNPFGDGFAAHRIVGTIRRFFGLPASFEAFRFEKNGAPRAG